MKKSQLFHRALNFSLFLVATQEFFRCFLLVKYRNITTVTVSFIMRRRRDVIKRYLVQFFTNFITFQWKLPENVKKTKNISSFWKKDANYNIEVFFPPRTRTTKSFQKLHFNFKRSSIFRNRLKAIKMDKKTSDSSISD